jgi:hypothetical protein
VFELNEVALFAAAFDAPAAEKKETGSPPKSPLNNRACRSVAVVEFKQIKPYAVVIVAGRNQQAIVNGATVAGADATERN